MATDGLAFGLLLAWAACLATGVALIVRRRRVLGALLAVEGLAGVAVTYVLATTIVGVGSTLLRIPVDRLAALGVIALALAAGVAIIVMRRASDINRQASGVTRQASRRASVGAAVLALAVPLASAAGLYGLVFMTTPERERERNPDARALQLPPGFRADMYLRSGASAPIDNPTAMTFAADGSLYLADIGGTIWAARDTDGDFVADRVGKFADGFSLAVGVLWLNDELYVASSTKVEALRDTNGDGVADARRTVVSGLPSMILQPHSNNALTLGPDGRIYFGVGATDRREETSALGSAILSVSPDGGDLRVFARGFGNPFELAFNRRGDMFAGDNALSGTEDENPPDELNFVRQGGNYGFPIQGDASPRTNPVVMFPPHSVPTGIAFYTGGTYPREYDDNAFLALWNRGEIVRVELARQADGSYSARPTRFGEGFLYPIDIAVGPDGNLYIADFGTSVVYRVTYGGAR